MTDSVDKLLAELKAEYDQTELAKVSPAQAVPLPRPLPPPPPPPAVGTVNDLLAQLDGQQVSHSLPHSVTPPRPTPHPPEPIAPRDFTALERSSPDDALLDQLRNHYQAQECLEAQQRQQQLQEQQRQQEQQQRQQRAAIAKKAEAWLKSLDPHSGDAVWFEAFAANYSSRLEAAIDYVATLSEQPTSEPPNPLF